MGNDSRRERINRAQGISNSKFDIKDVDGEKLIKLQKKLDELKNKAISLGLLDTAKEIDKVKEEFKTKDKVKNLSVIVINTEFEIAIKEIEINNSKQSGR